jgi:hypothetical protein
LDNSNNFFSPFPSFAAYIHYKADATQATVAYLLNRNSPYLSAGLVSLQNRSAGRPYKMQTASTWVPRELDLSHYGHGHDNYVDKININVVPGLKTSTGEFV